MERVYLGDWAYNAGIVGFIEIMLDGQELDKQNIIKVGDNYIEFDRSSLIGFSEKFFKKAYERYSRTDETMSILSNILQTVSETEDLGKIRENVQRFNKYLSSILRSFLGDKKMRKMGTRLKRILSVLIAIKEKLSAELHHKDDYLKYMKKAIRILNKNRQIFTEQDVKTYLVNESSIYGPRSFLNNQVIAHLLEKFKSDFEQPIINQTNKYDKKHSCVFCGLRPAKKDAMFDTGLVSFLGANKDNKNFFWNFKPKLPICEICEVIYFSIFAGLTEFRYGQNKKFYFVNRNESVKELYRSNKLFMEKMAKEGNLLKEKGILNFLNDYILLKLKEESTFRLANIAFIEIDLSSNFPKVYGFNISKQKAQFITSNYDILKKLTGSYFRTKEDTIYIFGKIMQGILDNTQSYRFLGTLEQIYINSLKPNPTYNTNLSAYKLQLCNVLIHKYLTIFKRGEKRVDEKQLWRSYYLGQELKKMFVARKIQNKITSLAYRLISALRVGDINTFMNLIIRTYMSLDKEVPSLFVSCIGDEESFCALGYSFVNGLLGQEKEESDDKEEVLLNE